jgi:tetratricopeptide (TPR) repeat protein
MMLKPAMPSYLCPNQSRSTQLCSGYSFAIILLGLMSLCGACSIVYAEQATGHLSQQKNNTSSVAPNNLPDDHCLIAKDTLAQQIEYCEHIISKTLKKTTLEDTKQTNTSVIDWQLKLVELYTRQGRFKQAEQRLGELQSYNWAQQPLILQFNYLRRQGILAYRQGRYPHALNLFQQAKALTNRKQNQQFPQLTGKALSDIGTAHLAMTEYPEALQAYQQSLTIKETYASPKSLAVTLNNIGSVYRKLKDWIKAEDYYTQALNYYIQADHQAAIAHTRENLGVIYLEQNQPKKAQQVFSQSLDYFQQSDQQHAQLRLLVLLASNSLQQEQLTIAQQYLDHAQSLELALGANDQSSKLKLALGKLQSLQGNYQQAESLYQSALQQAESQSDRSLELKALDLLVKNASHFSQWQKALQFQTKQMARQVDYFERSHDESLAQKRAFFEYDQQQKEIKLLNQDNRIKQLEISNNKNKITLLILTIFLLVMASVVFIIWLLKKRKQMKATFEQEIAFHRQKVTDLGSNYNSLKSAFGQLTQPIMLFNNQQTLIFSNNALGELLNIAPSKIEGEQLKNIIPFSNQTFWNIWQSEEDIEHRHLKDITLMIKGKSQQYNIIASSIHREEPMVMIIICDHHDANDLPVNAVLPQASYHQMLVDLMLNSLQIWEATTKTSRIELAEKSGIWRVSIDDGRLRTRSLDRYLTIKTLPKKPRWREVLRTAHFILAECDPPENDKTMLEQKLDRITQHIRAEALL